MKHIILSFAIVFLSFNLFAETQLEEIWKLCGIRNADIRIDEENIQLAKFKQQKDTSFGGNPYLGIDGNIAFPRDYEDNYAFRPSENEESVSFRHNLGSGTVLGASLKNTLTNEYQYYGENKFLQVTSASLSLTQSLAPAWAKGEKNDPYKERLQFSVLESTYSKEEARKTVLKNATASYIHLRYY